MYNKNKIEEIIYEYDDMIQDVARETNYDRCVSRINLLLKQVLSELSLNSNDNNIKQKNYIIKCDAKNGLFFINLNVKDIQSIKLDLEEIVVVYKNNTKTTIYNREDNFSNEYWIKDEVVLAKNYTEVFNKIKDILI